MLTSKQIVRLWIDVDGKLLISFDLFMSFCSIQQGVNLDFSVILTLKQHHNYLFVSDVMYLKNIVLLSCVW